MAQPFDQVIVSFPKIQVCANVSDTALDEASELSFVTVL